MRIDFFLDPGCPWCWLTSRWIVEVAPQRDLDVHWRAMSLLRKNEGDLDDTLLPIVTATHGMLRVLDAVRETAGNQSVGRLYTELGARIHHDHEHPPEIDVAQVLEETGLDPHLAEASTDEARDAAIAADMDEAFAMAGTDVGTPIVAFERRAAYFGPVVTPAPTGDSALRAFDAVAALALEPGFFELKRTRTVEPEMGERPAPPSAR